MSYDYDDYGTASEPDRALPKELVDKIDEHSKLCDGLKELYAKKNADYGDSMHPLFEEYGLTAFTILLTIKLQRIKNLQGKGNEIHYESIEDSLLDLANYALIAVTEMRAKKSKDKAELTVATEDMYYRYHKQD